MYIDLMGFDKFFKCGFPLFSCRFLFGGNILCTAHRLNTGREAQKMCLLLFELIVHKPNGKHTVSNDEEE